MLSLSLSLPTIITTSANLVSTNQCCLFKQFKNVYDSNTAVLHGIISKSDAVNVQFSTRVVPWIFPSVFQGLCSAFSIFLVICQNYRLMKIRSTYSNGEFRVPVNIKNGVLCHDRQQYCKELLMMCQEFLVI